MERKTMDKIAVLIPCYNEEKTIEKVVKDAKQALPEAVIYVYDNNSKDRTVEIAKEAGAVIRHEYMQGKGNVIRRMFREIDAQCYIMVDGDDTYPMEYAAEMVDKVLKKNADMLKQGTVDIARESERSIIDIETLQHTNGQLISTLDEVLQIQREGAQKRYEAEQELQRIEGELKAKLMELR